MTKRQWQKVETQNVEIDKRSKITKGRKWQNFENIKRL